MAEFQIYTTSGPYTEKEALRAETDMIHTLQSGRKAVDYHLELFERQSELEELISRHLGISPTEFTIRRAPEWIRGGFNICIFADIHHTRGSRLPHAVVLRVPQPFMIGEPYNPDAADEKLRCEAATYCWLRDNCPSIPIPRLLGFGFPGKPTFTAIENESLPRWILWQFRRGIAWLRGVTLAPYHVYERNTFVDNGYLLLEFVEKGEMLSCSWEERREDERKRSNLFNGIARIMLDLARVPLPRIGSWTIDNRGAISLTNRPFFDLTLFWNQARIPPVVPRTTTYDAADSFIHDLITYQDNRMRYELNSILNRKDGIYQLSALTGLRALLPKFWNASSRKEAFILSLPDLHKSNLFVDDDWNITAVIDLEFAPVVPMGFTQVPLWLSDYGCDQLVGPSLDEFKEQYDDLVEAVERQENFRRVDHKYSQSLRAGWDTGRYWFCLSLNSINGFPNIFANNLQPVFLSGFDYDTHGEILSQLWDNDLTGFLDGKKVQLEQYKARIHEIFEEVKVYEATKAMEEAAEEEEAERAESSTNVQRADDVKGEDVENGPVREG